MAQVVEGVAAACTAVAAPAAHAVSRRRAGARSHRLSPLATTAAYQGLVVASPRPFGRWFEHHVNPEHRSDFFTVCFHHLCHVPPPLRARPPCRQQPRRVCPACTAAAAAATAASTSLRTARAWVHRPWVSPTPLVVACVPCCWQGCWPAGSRAGRSKSAQQAGPVPQG
jgi:hypothetical protein